MSDHDDIANETELVYVDFDESTFADPDFGEGYSEEEEMEDALYLKI